jgi:hypothetical protein
MLASANNSRKLSPWSPQKKKKKKPNTQHQFLPRTPRLFSIKINETKKLIRAHTNIPKPHSLFSKIQPPNASSRVSRFLNEKPSPKLFLRKKTPNQNFQKKKAKCQEALKDCVSTRKTSLQPKGFSLAGVSKNSAGTKRQKTKEHEDEEGRRWKKGGVLRPPAIAGRPVHLLHFIFYSKKFSDRFLFFTAG